MRYRIDYRKALNAAQYEAATFKDGPLLVIAGAGSGKTRTIVYRVARLVEEGIPPHTILLLTFTRKSANEMLSRASGLLDHRCASVAGGTFHSFANTILKRFASRIGYDRGYTIIDRVDAENLIGMLRKELAEDAFGEPLPKKRMLANIFSKSINKGESIEGIVAADYPHFQHGLERILAIYEAYRENKADHGFFDYDDLLIHLKHLLEAHRELRDLISSTYRYVMVDEYQDTNQIQSEIVQLLAGDHRNIMAVGDDSQSIYSFRGACFKNIIDFPALFHGTRTIRLEENYRSIQPILDLTNRIIDGATEKYTKTLFTRRTGGNQPVLVTTATENQQSRYVLSRIHALRQSGVSLKEIAVLFRSGYHAFDLEIELSRNGVPFVKVGGFKFMESAHIKDLLALLRVVSNPRDRISWFRILLLLDKIGPKTASRIFDGIRKSHARIGDLANVRFGAIPSNGFRQLLQFFSGLADDTLTVAQLGEAALDFYRPLMERRFDDYPKRTKDLQQLCLIMQRYDSLKQFLTDMALEPPNTSVGGGFDADITDDDRLTLSTVHSAKGLEWHSVFIIWALDGRFPSSHSLERREELEEERRLFYVAATRARENLCFTCPSQIFDRFSRSYLHRPSRFLDSISDGILEKQFLEWE